MIKSVEIRSTSSGMYELVINGTIYAKDVPMFEICRILDDVYNKEET